MGSQTLSNYTFVSVAFSYLFNIAQVSMHLHSNFGAIKPHQIGGGHSTKRPSQTAALLKYHAQSSRHFSASEILTKKCFWPEILFLVLSCSRMHLPKSFPSEKAFSITFCIPMSTYTKMMTDGYSRIGRIDGALQIFHTMPDRDTLSWNAMIQGCSDCGNLDLARKLFDEMPERNCISWTTIIYGLIRSGRVAEAEELFDKMPFRDAVTWNSMIHGDCNNGRIDDACKSFEEMPSPNVVSWTTMIIGLNQRGDGNEALDFFRRMCISGVEPTSDTSACVLKAGAEIPSLDQGIQLLAYLVKGGHLNNTFITASLNTFLWELQRNSKFSQSCRGKHATRCGCVDSFLSGYGATEV
ncbi:hypothetical protein ACLOJK_010913 [Asimina triloba]